MNSNDFVSINEVLSDVIVLVNDEEFKRGLPSGYYKRQIKEAVEELAFDTFFITKTENIPFPKETLVLEMPKDAFNLREVFLFNGTCDQPTSTQMVWYKKGYHRGAGPNGGGETARRLHNRGSDPFLPTDSNPTNLYFYNAENGVIMFSSNCAGFDFVQLKYNGMGGAVDEIPIIPRVVRQAVIDYARVKILTVFVGKDRNLMPQLQLARLDLYGDMRTAGSWRKAERRIKTMDTKARDSYNEYFSRMNY